MKNDSTFSTFFPEFRLLRGTVQYYKLWRYEPVFIQFFHDFFTIRIRRKEKNSFVPIAEFEIFFNTPRRRRWRWRACEKKKKRERESEIILASSPQTRTDTHFAYYRMQIGALRGEIGKCVAGLFKLVLRNTKRN